MAYALPLPAHEIFVAQARVGGRKRRLTIGFAADMTLSKARAEALQALAAMRSGVDPTAERKARLAKSVTVAALADMWMAEFVRLKLKPRTASDYGQLLAKHILPGLGHLTVSHVGYEDIERLHGAMSKTPRRANYTIATVRALLNFAIRRGLRPAASNPARGIKMYREKARERFLSEAEMAPQRTRSSRPSGKGRSARSGQRGYGLHFSPVPARARSLPFNGDTSIGNGSLFGCRIARPTSHAPSI